ncbi:MAG: LLM class F420-dependent oxidoreductase [Candidatus Xenobia bacterium]
MPAIYRFAFTQIDEVEALARQTEQLGFDGLMLSDSQNLQSDPYASLTLAARCSQKLTLGTAATNIETRHPAVTACSIATLDEVSQGRALLGVGRGDTAITRLGIKPRPLDAFEAALKELQAYLRGETVGPSPIVWLAGRRKVPLSLFASGPRAIAVGAACAEQLTLAVGAEPAWVSWGQKLAGSTPVGLVVLLGLGAGGRELVRGNVSLFAQFAGAARRVPGLLSPEDCQLLDRAGLAYRAGQAPLPLPDDFVERFAVVGEPQHCLDRLRALLALGLDHLLVVGPWKTADPKLVADHEALLPDLLRQLT